MSLSFCGPQAEEPVALMLGMRNLHSGMHDILLEVKRVLAQFVPSRFESGSYVVYVPQMAASFLEAPSYLHLLSQPHSPLMCVSVLALAMVLPWNDFVLTRSMGHFLNDVCVASSQKT